MAGKAKERRGFGRKLKDQQVTNKELYNISANIPLQSSSSAVAGGSQGGGTVVQVASQDIYMNTYDIVDLDRLKFATKEGAGDILTNTDYGIEAAYFSGDAYGILHRVPSGKQHLFMRGDDIVFAINSDEILLSDDISLSGYADIFKIAEPDSPPTNYRRIFSDSDNSDNLSVKRSDGTVIDLEAGGWSGNATSDLDMNTWDIIDVDRLQFTSDSGVGRDNTKVEMYANANPDAVINFPDGKKFRWTQNGQSFVDIDEDGLTPRLDGGWQIGTSAYNIGYIHSRAVAVYGTGSGVGGTKYGFVLDNSDGQVGVDCSGDGTGAFTSVWNGLEDLGMSTNYWKDLYIAEIQMKDTSANPTTNGQFTRNGNDVKVYTGGGVKNLSDIGSGGGSGANTALSNLTTTSINQSLLPSSSTSKDLGSASKQWRYLYVDVQANIDYLSMTGNIDMNSNDISEVSDLNNTGGGNGTFAWSGSGSHQVLCNVCAIHSGLIELGNSSSDTCEVDATLKLTSNTSSDTTLPASPTGKLLVKVGSSSRYIYYYST